MTGIVTPFDDYPIHQTPLPVAHVASGDRNHYDRYFFNGYHSGGEWFFAFAMGLYPNRHVIDAAFSVVRGGVQRSVFASGRAPADPATTRVGPIAIEVVSPLRVNRLFVSGDELRAELEWRPRTAAVCEPRQTMMDGNVTIMDVTRFVQWGTWQGRIEIAGERIALDGALGTKDRSWGVRPVGEPPPGAPSGFQGVFFLWAPVNFPDECTHLMLFERPDGSRTHESAFTVPLDCDPAPARLASYSLEWRPGTRRARAAAFDYELPDGSRERLTLEPVLDFHMKGIGYFHPRWAHGVWHGEGAGGTDEWVVADLDPLELPNLHVEQLCRARMGGTEGVGVLEQLAIGPHAPTGLEGLLDGSKT